MMRVNAIRIKRYFPIGLKYGSGQVLPHRDKSNKTMNLSLIWNCRYGTGQPPCARRKVAVSVRLDPRVLDLLRSKGEGRLTRINDILFNLMEAERRIEAGR
jgi:uncharacterized protein (DUF4415 family)